MTDQKINWNAVDGYIEWSPPYSRAHSNNRDELRQGAQINALAEFRQHRRAALGWGAFGMYSLASISGMLTLAGDVTTYAGRPAWSAVAMLALFAGYWRGIFWREVTAARAAWERFLEIQAS